MSLIQAPFLKKTKFPSTPSFSKYAYFSTQQILSQLPQIPPLFPPSSLLHSNNVSNTKFQTRSPNQDCYNYIMLANPNPFFQTLLNKLLIGKRYEHALLEGEKTYQTRAFRINTLTPFDVTSFYYHIKNKFYDKGKACQSESWFENELRIFIWLLIGHSFIEERPINQMKNEDWVMFSKIFNERRPDIFQFQGMSILKKSITKCRKWSYNQSGLLEEIIRKRETKNKWNQIARQLFIISNKQYFRTAKQCREHWINHLDPSPIRTNWTLEEDYKLIWAVSKLGKKWSKISKRFGGSRTEHMVKNRYKSLLHFLKKGQKNLEGELSEKKLMQLHLEDLEKGIKNQASLKLLFGQVQSRTLHTIQSPQIQSAVQANSFEAEIQIENDIASHSDKEFDAFDESSLNNLQLNNPLSLKPLRDDFSIFMQPENNKSIFEDCLNIFLAEDFKKFQFLQQ